MSIPSKISGWNEWTPQQQAIENQILNAFRSVYERFGFVPLKTHSVEREETFHIKGEIEKQIYKIINPNSDDSDLCLRFDLTVPVARYIAQNQNILHFPFKRYQMQKVWRGERAQKGRFREFYQCDVDIVGRVHLPVTADVEVIATCYYALCEIGKCGIPFKGRFNINKNIRIHLSNRKILFGIFDAFNLSDKDREAILQNLDKIEKVVDGVKAVRMLLEEKLAKTDREKADIVLDLLLDREKTNSAKFASLDSLRLDSALYKEGVEELKAVYSYLKKFRVPEDAILVDLTIVRGLDYYSGTVFETFLEEHKSLGSICSGGRYDNLVGAYSSEIMPGVGGSIGLTRLLFFLFSEGIIDIKQQTFSDVLLVNIGDESNELIDWMMTLSEFGIRSEIYHVDTSGKKVGKVLPKAGKYCQDKGVRYMLVYGPDEKASNIVTLKDTKLGFVQRFALTDDFNHTMSMIAHHIQTVK